VKARNPWGGEGYRGVWSDKDTAKWTPEAKNALNHELGNDGAFFIPFSEFHKYANGIEVFAYDDWKTTTLQEHWDR